MIVLPEAEELDVVLRPVDLKIDVFRSQVCARTLTYVPAAGAALVQWYFSTVTLWSCI